MLDCHKCGKGFPDKAHLERHLNNKKPCKAISPEEKLTCKECNKKFANLSNLYKHRKNVHPPQPVQTDRIAQAGASIVGNNNTAPTTNNITINIKNFNCPSIDFLENMPAAKLKEMLGELPGPSMISKVFSEIYLSDDKPENHSVLLESLTSETGFCFIEKWRKQATRALITQCASNAALKLADFEHVYESILTKSNAKAVSEVCDTVEKEDFSGELYQTLLDRISQTLVEFTNKKEALLQVAKSEAKGTVKYPKSEAFDGWKEGGHIREAAIERMRD